MMAGEDFNEIMMETKTKMETEMGDGRVVVGCWMLFEKKTTARGKGKGRPCRTTKL